MYKLIRLSLSVTSLALFLSAQVACLPVPQSAGAAPAGPRRPFDPKVVPAGAGWWCYSETRLGEKGSECFRGEGECVSSQRGASQQGRFGGSQFSTCTSQSTAYCYSHGKRFGCSAALADCDRSSSGHARMQDDPSGVSACAEAK